MEWRKYLFKNKILNSSIFMLLEIVEVFCVINICSSH